MLFQSSPGSAADISPDLSLRNNCFQHRSIFPPAEDLRKGILGGTLFYLGSPVPGPCDLADSINSSSCPTKDARSSLYNMVHVFRSVFEDRKKAIAAFTAENRYEALTEREKSAVNFLSDRETFVKVRQAGRMRASNAPLPEVTVAELSREIKAACTWYCLLLRAGEPGIAPLLDPDNPENSRRYCITASDLLGV